MSRLLEEVQVPDGTVYEERIAEFPTILFVTDDEDLKVVLQTRFEKANFGVGIADTCFAAGYQAGQLAPWVIVIDFGLDDMPEHICHSVRMQNPQVILVGLVEEHQRPSDRLGLRRVLRKPVTGGDLCQLLDDLVPELKQEAA